MEDDEKDGKEPESTDQASNNQSETIEIDGEHYTKEQIKGGMLRQADYTRKRGSGYIGDRQDHTHRNCRISRPGW